MVCVDVSYPSPAENLACEELMVMDCEAGGPETLRFWDPPVSFVVVGYGNAVATEVNVPACQAEGIPILRRVSGGGAVVQTPGCLNYALVLRAPPSGPLASIPGANQFIMERHAAALSRLLGQPVAVRGHTDLAVSGRKCSGNAQRRGRHTLLFHGCLLLQASLGLMERCLNFPSRQPEYRQSRPHREFVMNLGLPADQVKQALREAWGATTLGTGPARERVAALARDKYQQADWNFRF